jgi:hypothetical protein
MPSKIASLINSSRPFRTPARPTAFAGRSRLEVEQRRQQGDAGYAIDHRVMDLRDVRGAALAETVDELHLPQRLVARQRP